MVKISDAIPRLASRVSVGGEPIYCEPGGETLDFGTGEIQVNSAAEKRRVLREHGVMPAPEGLKTTAKYDPSKVPSFKEHFYKERGASLDEVGPNLVYGVED